MCMWRLIERSISTSRGPAVARNVVYNHLLLQNVIWQKSHKCVPRVLYFWTFNHNAIDGGDSQRTFSKLQIVI